MAWFMAHYSDIIAIITGLVTSASVIVKLTPTPQDDSVLAKVVGILEFLALNKKA